MNTIKYNGADPFLGIASTPLFIRSFEPVEYNGRWAAKNTFALQGVLTGRCLTVEQTKANQETLLSSFGTDFRELVITEDGSDIASFPLCQVDEISFDPNNYVDGYLPFEIKLSQYPSGYFSGDYGVLDPSDVTTYAEEQDGVIRVTRAISARGLNTSAGDVNAFENAEAFVAARTGLVDYVSSYFVSSGNFGQACLKSQRKTIDRLNARYEVQEEYVYDKYRAGISLLRYTTELTSGVDDGFVNASVEGSLVGCRDQALSSLRDEYASFNAFDEAIKDYQRFYGQTDLNAAPLIKSVSEDSTRKIINFSYGYSNDSRPPISLEIETDYQYAFELDLISASVTVTVSSREQYTTETWAKVLAVANQVNMFSLANSGYQAYIALLPNAAYLAGYPLNPTATSTKRTENEFGLTVVLSATFDSRVVAPPGFRELSSRISVTPATRIYTIGPILDGEGDYYITDIGCVRRGAISIELQGIVADGTNATDALARLKLEALKLQSIYLPGTEKTLNSQELNRPLPIALDSDAFSKTVSLSAAYSAKQDEFIIA